MNTNLVSPNLYFDYVKYKQISDYNHYLENNIRIKNIGLRTYIRSYNTTDLPTMMKGLRIFIFAFFIKLMTCSDFDSYEVNRIEFTPLHDAIIFNDIADIMNEFENNMYSEINTPITNYSESDENIEDLLSEYQHYLDKAHKQRVNYIDKTKNKNKVPLVRHEKYIKSKPNAQTNEQMSYYFNGMKHYPTPFYKAFETKYLLNPDLSKQNYENVLKPTYKEKALLDLPPTMVRASYEPMLSSCHCKANQIPCKCPCKQCIVTGSESVGELNNQDMRTHNSSNDKLSIRIKVDVQLPTLPDIMNFLKWHNNDKVDGLDRLMSKEFQSSVNLPLPYANFPMPLNMFDFNNSFLKSSSPLHKITIHKKKKSHFNNSNKKHKNKKNSYHHENIDSQLQINNTELPHNINLDKNKSISEYNNDTNSYNVNNTTLETFHNIANDKSKLDVPKTNVNKSIDTIYVTVNISKTDDNSTDEPAKIENSIESEYEKDSITTGQPLRLKREIIELNVLPIKPVATINVTNVTRHKNQSSSHGRSDPNQSDKVITAGDANLLYWPVECHNLSVSGSTKNITVLIMEREAKKRKLNMTHEAIRSNRTKALEKAIFGDVNWNDVDTVAPVFISFVGKYITGVLTFCSESVCHSMKCSDKVCTHRICLPQNRFNQNGHCSGNNNTDSIANMESIMDLPSIIAFEIVDILEDNMSGKIYGKMTLCINSKCCTFVAAKKHFQKSKCTFKEVDVSGHCPNLKNAKVK